MRTKKKQPKNSQKNNDLIFKFTGCKFNVMFEPESVPEEVQEQIKNDILELAQEIWIDKSYVKFKQNKHEDVFLSLEGWDMLMMMLEETDYGDNASDEQYELIVSSYYAMVLGYICSMILQMYPEQIGHMSIENSASSSLDVDIMTDNIHDWQHYNGRWQNRSLEEGNTENE